MALASTSLQIAQPLEVSTIRSKATSLTLGTQTPFHCHTGYSEQLYVLEGEFTVWAGEKKAIVSADESFLVTPSTSHTIGVFTEKPARGLVVAAPSAFARLIAAVGTLDETEPSHMILFERIWAEIGDEFLGPPGALLSTATKT